ncbi:MAG: hypothetical protein AAF371_13570 [Pseudomonadota bacterium]
MKWLYAAGMLCVPLILFLFQSSRLDPYDEGIMLMHGMMMERGFLPGRDHYSTYGPLSYFAVGKLFTLGDGNPFFVRTYYAAAHAIAVVGFTMILRPWRSLVDFVSAVLLTVILLFVFVIWQWPTNPSFIIPSLCALFMLVALMRDDVEDRPMSALRVAATFVVLLLPLVFLRPVVAGVLGAGLIAAVPFHLHNHGRLGANELLAQGAGILGALVALALAVLAFELATDNALSALLTSLGSIGTDTYERYRGLPFPPVTSPLELDTAFIYLPVLLVVLCGAIYFVALIKRDLFSPGEKDAILFLLVFSGGLYSLNIVRTDLAHAVPSLLAATALAAFIVNSVLKRALRGVGIKGYAMVAGVLLLAMLPLMKDVLFARSYNRILIDCDRSLVVNPPYNCLDMGDERHDAVRDELRARLQDDEPFLSANMRHDIIYTNNVSHYALVGHGPLTYWAQMDPGVHTTERIQREIVADIERTIGAYGRALVVLEEHGPSNEPNESDEPSGVLILDDRLADCDRLIRHEPTWQYGALELRECR